MQKTADLQAVKIATTNVKIADLQDAMHYMGGKRELSINNFIRERKTKE